MLPAPFSKGREEQEKQEAFAQVLLFDLSEAKRTGYRVREQRVAAR